MMRTEYRREKFREIYADAKALIRAHWDEVASLPEARKLDIDEGRYLDLESKDLLLCVSARRDGVLVGYVAGFIAPDMHAKANKMKVCDAYYVEPYSRRKGVAEEMFSYYEASAKVLGCQTGTMRQKLIDGVPNIPDRFFERMGYVKTEAVWMKRL